MNLTKNDKYTSEDLTSLRLIYDQIKVQENLKMSKQKNQKRFSEFNKVSQMKLKIQ